MGKRSLGVLALLAVSFWSKETFASGCVTVKAWSELAAAISQADDVTFCPFSVKKEEDERIVINGEKRLTCSQPKRCAIRGPGDHFVVRGNSAKLTLDGFTFMDATESAFIVQTSSPLTHVLERCVFRGNFGQRGGAIRTETGTSLTIRSTRFDGNEAHTGGAIDHSGGALQLVDSIFKDNLALRGAGVFLSASARVGLENTKFLGNVATEQPMSGAISAASSGTIESKAKVRASDNGSCNGIYDRSKSQCNNFQNGGSNVGAPGCVAEGGSCANQACCGSLECNGSPKTCQEKDDDSENEKPSPSYSYSGSGCNVKGPSPTSSNTLMVFLAIGDTPYDARVGKAPFEGGEYKCLRDSILPKAKKLASSVDFIAHVGDIKKGGSGFANYCNDQVFRSRRDLFVQTEPDLDLLLVVGDNEWNECKGYNRNPRVNDTVKNLWRKYFTKGALAGFDRKLPFGGNVQLERQAQHPENFFFYYDEQEIAFFGITEPMKENQYDPINADWIVTKLRNKRPRALVILSHSKLSNKVLSALPKNAPVLHIAGNTHDYCMQHSGREASLVELTVDAFKASPLRVSVVKDPSDRIFFSVEKTSFGC